MEVVIRAPGSDSTKARLLPLPAAAAVAAHGEAARAAAMHDGDELERMRADIGRAVRADIEQEIAGVAAQQRERARAAGREAGLSEGRLAAQQELAALRTEEQAATRRALEALRSAHRQALAQLEAAVGEVAFAAVCRIAGSAAMTRAFVMGIVQQACSRLPGDLPVSVRLHPRDLATLGKSAGEVLTVDATGIQLIADDSLALGGCVVESTGRIDATLSTQLTRLHELLLAGGPGAWA